MRAISYEGKDTVTVVDRPVPEASGRQALIKVAYAGICGSDLSIVSGKHPRAKAPLVMGHEFSGTLAALPPETSAGLQVGDRVTVYPLLSCGECYVCKMGLPHVCRQLRLIGIDRDGGFAEYVTADTGTIFKIPDAISDREGALIEPVAVCMHSVAMSRLQLGDTVVVTGAGPIGMLMALVARAAGAAQVIVTEVVPLRVEAAREAGFTVLNAADTNLVSQVQALTGGRGGDIVFECTGHPSVAPYLLDLVRIRGQIVQVGIYKQPVPLDMRTLNFHEIDIIGARVYTPEDYSRTISLMAQGKLDLAPLLTSLWPLEEAVAGFQAAQQGTTLKVMFEI